MNVSRRNFQKGQGALIFVIFVAVILLIGGFVLYTQTQTPQTTTPRNKASQSTGEFTDTGGDPLENQDLLDDLINDPNSLSGTLEDVSGGNSSGIAYVLRKDGKLWHTVNANLPEPPLGTVYEGWLVNKTPALAFFSTGLLEKQDNGAYTLSYTNQSPFFGYDEVVVTIESEVDEIPEEHILEGVVK